MNPQLDEKSLIQKRMTDNETIAEMAEFMGLKSRKIVSEVDYEDDITVYYENDPKKWFNPPQYDSDWHQLMPVWYKFRLLTLEESNFTSEFIALKRSIEYSILNAGIKTACRLLAEGIRWYNTINK